MQLWLGLLRPWQQLHLWMKKVSQLLRRDSNFTCEWKKYHNYCDVTATSLVNEKSITNYNYCDIVRAWENVVLVNVQWIYPLSPEIFRKELEMPYKYI